jgi:hypothetical protein
MQAEDGRLNGEEFSEKVEINRAWEKLPKPYSLI